MIIGKELEMTLKKLKDSKPFCIQCGRKRGVSLWEETFYIEGSLSKRHYLTCVSCRHKWEIFDWGFWLQEY